MLFVRICGVSLPQNFIAVPPLIQKHQKSASLAFPVPLPPVYSLLTWLETPLTVAARGQLENRSRLPGRCASSKVHVSAFS